MKVIILAGGLGTRLSEETNLVPKPMVEISGKPILIHIMEIYASFGFNDFYLALGYKSHLIKDYFLKYHLVNSNFSVNLENGKTEIFHQKKLDWRVNLVDTGLETMTGGRIKRMKDFIGDETFLLTYGDGLANINIKELVKFHNNHDKIATVTAVRPIARFGELEFDNKNQDIVKSFMEKPQINQGWINGGFFVFNKEIFDYLDNDDTILERKPLESLSKKSQLKAYKHNGFWQCMDTKRDKDLLNELYASGQAPWKV